MLAALVLFALCASGFAQANNDCAAQRQCGQKLSSLQPAYPLTTCSEDVKNKIPEAKTCLTDMMTGKLTCMPAGAPPMQILPGKVGVIRKGIEGLANSVCKGCPIVSAIVECIKPVASTIDRVNPCNETAFYAMVAKVQNCMVGKLAPSMEACLAVRPHIIDTMKGIIEYVNNSRKQACQRREGSARKRSIVDSLKEYQDFLWMFK